MKNKKIAFIPPSGTLIYQDDFFNKVSKYFINNQKIETYLVIIETNESIVQDNNIFNYVMKVKDFEDLVSYLKEGDFHLIFHRSWMHRYKFAGNLVSRVENVVVYIKDWMDEIPLEKYKFLYETDDDYDGIKEVFLSSKLVLSHYSNNYMNQIAYKYGVAQKKFVFFPEYCSEDRFVVKPLREKSNIKLLWAGGIASTIAPSEISENKSFFQTFQYITKYCHICIDMYLLKRYYDNIHNPVNKNIWSDWLYEDKFNNNLNIKLGTTTQFEIFSNYDFAIVANLWYDKNDLSMVNTCNAVISKFALYLEIGIPIVVNKKWKAIAKIVKEYGLGVIISNKEIKNLNQVLTISEDKYNAMIDNIYKFRQNYTYNKKTMKPIMEILYER